MTQHVSPAGPTDCIVEGEVLKLGGPFLQTWQKKHLKLYPNRLEFYHKNRDGQVVRGKGVEVNIYCKLTYTRSRSFICNRDMVESSESRIKYSTVERADIQKVYTGCSWLCHRCVQCALGYATHVYSVLLVMSHMCTVCSWLCHTCVQCALGYVTDVYCVFLVMPQMCTVCFALCHRCVQCVLRYVTDV